MIAKLNAAVLAALADPTVQRDSEEAGQSIWPRALQTPEALAAHQKAEIEKWWPVIRAANIKAEINEPQYKVRFGPFVDRRS